MNSQAMAGHVPYQKLESISRKWAERFHGTHSDTRRSFNGENVLSGEADPTQGR